MKKSAFTYVNGVVLILLSAIMLAPFVHVIALSFSDPVFVQAKLVSFWPRGFQVEMYKKVLTMPSLWRAMGVSVWITAAGTALALLLTSTMAYGLSRPRLAGRKWIMRFLMLTFILPAPLIPGFLLIRSMGMVNTLWALIIPGATSAFNVVIMRTFFQGIPGELLDAAKIDGCGEAGIYLRIVMPMSLAVISTIGLFHAVGQWNSYFGALIYIRDKRLYPLQVMIQQLIVEKGASDLAGSGNYTLMLALSPEIMSSSLIIISTIPILLVYPFLQKHFVKGAMIGSLKE